MPETEKQEGQKTVVAFITGLLIGGLLVWVFSSTPETEAPSSANTDDTEEVKLGDMPRTVTTTTVSDSDSSPEPAEPAMPTGEGSIEVDDQEAGNSVMLGALEYPTSDGWVAVRELVDGMPGNILGAARYSTDQGLLPTEVNLQRATESGKSYLVVFYTEDGDRDFNLRNDRQIEGPAATFMAE
jgi:hypothetical protein